MQRFERIYEEHREAVRAYVRRRAPEAVVDAVVADVFVVCLRRIDDVPEPALPWLYAVARRTLANERRKRGREAPRAAAFTDLSDRDREVLRLVAWEGLSVKETAAVLGCSAIAARLRFHRAKSRTTARS